MKYGDKGPEVYRVQRALIEQGYDLPVFGADGDFGREVQRKLMIYAADIGVPWPDPAAVPKLLLERLLARVREPEKLEPIRPTLELDIEFFDLRSEAPDPHPKSKQHRRKTVRRALGSIDAIVIHQTATRCDPRGNEHVSRRALDMACHAMAMRNGLLVWAAELDRYIYHADRLNARSLGLEIEGVFPGVVGGEITVDQPETPLTDELVAAARAGLELLVNEGRRAGCPIKYIYAHRQCDRWRRADPGEGVWRRVVLEYAVPELGLVTQPQRWFRHPYHKDELYKRRHGRPIPRNWDPGGDGEY